MPVILGEPTLMAAPRAAAGVTADAASFAPAEQQSEFIHNPINTTPKYVFNRGFMLDAADLSRVQQLSKAVVIENTLATMKYPGLVPRVDTYVSPYALTTAVPSFGLFEILAQAGNDVLVNTGVGYDGYGNRLVNYDRQWITLTFPGSLPADPDPFGYLCVRRKAVPTQIAYMNHPETTLSTLAIRGVDIEFYVTAALSFTTIGSAAVNYPPLDSNGFIEGLVIGKVYVDAENIPDMTVRSPLLAVRDGDPQYVPGYNLG